MKEERRDTQDPAHLTWFDIAIHLWEGTNRVSHCCPVTFSSVLCYHPSTCCAGTPLMLKKRRWTCLNNALGSAYQIPTAFVAHSAKIATNFFQKTALIYEHHVTVRSRLFLFQCLNLWKVLQFLFCGWQFWNRDRWFIIHISLETCLKLETLPAFLKKELFSLCFGMFLFIIKKMLKKILHNNFNCRV